MTAKRWSSAWWLARRATRQPTSPVPTGRRFEARLTLLIVAAATGNGSTRAGAVAVVVHHIWAHPEDPGHAKKVIYMYH